MAPRLAGLLLALVVLVAGGLLVGRGVATTRVEDGLDGRVAVECTGWTGITEGCAAWGERIWTDGAPSSTFEIEDVVRLRFDRAAFGFGDCSAEWFVSRYPEEPAWSAPVPCAES